MSQSFFRKYGTHLGFLIGGYFLYEGIRIIYGTQKVDQEKFGVKYNSERRKIGLTEIPSTFVITEKPIRTLWDIEAQKEITPWNSKHQNPLIQGFLKSVSM